ncbi:Uncharacterized [Syntrophomonas zehnderi OL-4]|uniref:Uncharacterized n=1 Tax=Syntrophomonas zehnderi OL-4 TaxID=690567 RepID=A0A0E4GCW3_9FIRM|nr:hypothetical protein [Syntrophomonas zehnderi]CFX27187.1 Uncharacterized [Syntrophomonas zehnderi OL-4]
MSLPLLVLLSGITGVFLVMIFLQLMVTLSSKLAIFLENKAQSKTDQ